MGNFGSWTGLPRFTRWDGASEGQGKDERDYRKFGDSNTGPLLHVLKEHKNYHQTKKGIYCQRAVHRGGGRGGGDLATTLAKNLSGVCVCGRAGISAIR